MSKLAVEEVLPVDDSSSEVLSNYGIPTDPFDDIQPDTQTQVNPFFMGGDRRAVLDEVSHLCQFSNNVVAVLGEAGVGKTAFVHQVLLELEETAQCCLIQSSVMATVDDVLNQLAAHLGVYIPEEADVNQFIASIAQYQPSGLQQRVVVVVDDAHHLNDDILSALIQLLQQQSSYYLHVLLVGDSSLLLRLDQLDKGEILTYDIPLCPFTVDELGDYLTFKLALVGYQGAELFDYDAVHSIWRDTRGIPASVNRAAKQMLLNHSLTEEEERALGLPIWHMALVVILLAALVMAVFYVGDDEATETGVTEDIVAPTLDEPALVDQSSIPSNTQISSSDGNEGNAVVAEPLPVEPENNTGIPADNSEQSVAIKTPVVATPSESVAVDISKPTGAEVAELPVKPTQQPETVDVAAATVEPPKEPVQVSPPATQNQSRGSLTRDEEAVMFWPSEDYTLQVLGAGQLPSVKQFVASQSNRVALRIVSVERNGSPWYVVVTGVYDSVEQAREAVKLLPKEQSSAKPWPRSISGVQQEINDFRRK